MAALLTGFQVAMVGSHAESKQSRMESVVASLESAVPREAGRARTYITDHPMWLAGETGDQAITLPDEDVDSLLELGSFFETPYVVVIDERGRYPAALLDEDARACLAVDPRPLVAPGEDAWLFQLAQSCDPT